MSKKTVELLLVENVENLGIVGDLVKVKTGYARNFLLPHGYATTPSQELIDQLSEKRKQAQAEMAELRRRREAMIAALDGTEIKVTRSANDQGLLYGSVTQHELAELIAEAGHPIRDRDVRLGETIKRVGHYDITIKPEQDLETTVHLIVEPEGGFIEDQEDDNEAAGEAEPHSAEEAAAEAGEGSPAAEDTAAAEDEAIAEKA